MRTVKEIRIIAPSSSWRHDRTRQYQVAIKRLEETGYKVTLGKHIKTAGRFGMASAAERLEDLHNAYKDSSVDAILCLNGGWSANELLPGIDWDLIRINPKPLIGYSDITVLINAIYAKTGQIGLLGPILGSFGGHSCWEFTLNSLHNVLAGQGPLELTRSREWRSSKRKLAATRPWKMLQPGTASGTLIGGNIGTYYLLQGTDFAPKLKGDIILAVEDDDEAGKITAREFDRRLESLLQQPGARSAIKGVIVGRFQPESRMSMPDIVDIIGRKFSKNIPVIADIDFGHTKPLLTLPIGGQVSINADKKPPIIKLLKY